MTSPTDPGLIGLARKLRRGMTDGEKRLWLELREFRRHYGIHVRRQSPIGPYVVDFVIPDKALVIEVDGEHHQRQEQMERDARRDAWLSGQGYDVMRLTSREVWHNLDGCIESILRRIGVA